MIVTRRRGDGVAALGDSHAAARGAATDAREPEPRGALELACVAVAEAGRQCDEQLVLFPAPRRGAGADARPAGNPLEGDLRPHPRRGGEAPRIPRPSLGDIDQGARAVPGEPAAPP